MNQVKQLREYTRELECHLANMNQSDCCQCGVNTSQCFLLVENRPKTRHLCQGAG